MSLRSKRHLDLTSILEQIDVKYHVRITFYQNHYQDIAAAILLAGFKEVLVNWDSGVRRSKFLHVCSAD